MNTETNRRPFGVSFLSILVIIGGILDIVAGIVLLTQRNDESLLESLGVKDSEVTTYAIVAIAFGVVAILVGGALRGGADWARLLIALIAVARLASFIWVAAAYHRVHWYDSLAPLVLYSVVAGYLFFDDDAKRYFSRN
jgi:hypothetical protein